VVTLHQIGLPDKKFKKEIKKEKEKKSGVSGFSFSFSWSKNLEKNFLIFSMVEPI
jgi:hypothetical protein